MKTSRRMFLGGAGAAAAAAFSGSAQAQNFLEAVINAPRRGAWQDQFDAQVSAGGEVSSTLPVLSPQTVGFVERAIADYSTIVASGGWPTVPATKKLQIGVIDPDVEILRRRLMISGDLSTRAGLSPAFDTYVDAALKRFQARHGLPADGVTGQYTYSALNVSAPVRLGQLQTNLGRLRDLTSKPLGDRYVMVKIGRAHV